jgi:hypothetical protein
VPKPWIHFDDRPEDGFGPSGTKAGNLVSIIRNTLTPFILRPVEGKPGHFAFLGEAHVHGLMYGEAFKIVDEALDRDSRLVESEASRDLTASQLGIKVYALSYRILIGTLAPRLPKSQQACAVVLEVAEQRARGGVVSVLDNKIFTR